MDRKTFLQGLLAMSTIGACSGKPGTSRFKTYHGPEVTRVVVYKSARNMYLLHRDRVLKRYHIDLGFAPDGHKQAEGDGRTPEGDYLVDRRNPNSAFHLSLGLSYPNAQDRARARALGRDPGGDIFIHGDPRLSRRLRGPDWTAGCIAVTNDEIEDIYAMVTTGTPVSIYP